MEPRNTTHPYDRRWLASVVATAVPIAINNWFVLGRAAFALAAAIVLLALGMSAITKSDAVVRFATGSGTRGIQPFSGRS
jgi:hypothetical protein